MYCPQSKIVFDARAASMSFNFPIPDWGDDEGFHYPGISIDEEIVIKEKSKNKKRKLNGDGTFEKHKQEDWEVTLQASKKKKTGKIDTVTEIKKIQGTKELTRSEPKKIKKEETKNKTKKTFSNQENQNHASELQNKTGNKNKKKKNRKNNKYKELNERQKEERIASQTSMAESKSESKQQNIMTIKKSQESFQVLASKEEVESIQDKEVKKKKKKKKKSKSLDNANNTVHKEDSTVSLKNSPDTSHHDAKQDMKDANGHGSEINSHNSQAIDVDIKKKKKKKSVNKTSNVILLSDNSEQSCPESNSHLNASNAKLKKNKIKSENGDVDIIEIEDNIGISASKQESEEVVAEDRTKKEKKKKKKENLLKAKDSTSDSKVKIDKQMNGGKFLKIKENDDKEELIFDGDEECSESFKKDLGDLLSSLNFSQMKTLDSSKVGKKSKGKSNNVDDNDDEFEMSSRQEFPPTKKCKRSMDKDNEDEKKNNGLVKKKNESAKTNQKKLNNRQDSNESQTPKSPVKKKAKFNKERVARLLEEAAKIERKKQSSTPSTPIDSLKHKMEERLMAARFRMVNEELYTRSSSEAQQLFKKDPAAFDAYHHGYQSQVRQWPVNPLDLIIKWLSKKPKEWVVADMGCGEGTLAQRVPQSCVHSLDLVAANSQVTACDMAHTPLSAASVDAVVFCLSLMGTNLKDFMMEANRILKAGGIMKIAEVESRFGDVKEFEKHLAKYGFHCTAKDTSHQYFFLFDFKKTHKLKKTISLPDIFLKPCLYKKR